MKPTPEQRRIIDFGLVPLRVAAGAGTGKTTTMAWRLADLVRRYDLAPEETLGLTFTNKAADELAAGLRRQLPAHAEEGRQVEVATYHGFAHGLLNEFGALVGLERSAHVLAPGYARQLLREVLGTGQYDHLDLTAPANRVDELAQLAGQLGDHLLDPEALMDHPGDDTSAKRAELAAALRRYRDLKATLGAADYADLIALAHRLVANNPEVAGRIRNRYRVLLLDEYQDTNAAQRRLLLAIFGGGFPVTAVGDATQTIYEWRGASLSNFRDFPSHFLDSQGNEAVTLDLRTNQRSDRRILELANKARSQIGDQALGSGLAPRAGAEDGFVGYAMLHSAGAEARFVAAEIERLHDDEGFSWREMGVLFRKNAQVSSVRDALESADIPFQVASLGGLLEVRHVLDLYAWLRLLGRAGDSPALMRILLRGPYRLGLGDLAPLTKWVKDRHRRQAGWALIEAVEAVDDIEDVRPEARRRLHEFLRQYRRLLQDAQRLPLSELGLSILDAMGVWQEIEALPESTGTSARLNLHRFLDLIEQWSPLEGRPSLDAFLDYMGLLGEDRAAEELDTARLSNEDAVALLTIHRAKGLEWRAVFLPAVVEETFPAKQQVYEDPASRAYVLPFEDRIDSSDFAKVPRETAPRRAFLQAAHYAQEWRTAYVALTRARERLYLTAAHWYDGVTPKDPSRLFEMARTIDGSIELAAEPRGERPEPEDWRVLPSPDPLFGSDGWIGALRATVADGRWPERQARDRGLLGPYHAHVEQLRIELEGIPSPPDPASDDAPFQTSVTGLVTYATCPLRFRWTEVDPLPRRVSTALRRGIELHRRIELHNLGRVPLDEQLEDQYDLGPGEGIDGATDPFTAFKESRFAKVRPRFVEAPFNLRIGEAWVRGRVDAIYEDDRGEWEIVDFKGGRPSDDPARRVQLEAYAVAATDVPFAPEQPQSLKVTFAYLGEGAQAISEEVDDSWLAAARERLGELTAGAASGDFPAKPSPACRSCDFAAFCQSGKAWLEANPD